MNIVSFNGWARNVRVSNAEIELVIPCEIGPRILRCAFVGEKNLFAEVAGQQGGTGERDWKIRGGHRLWIAPEVKPWTYEPDNDPVAIRRLRGGVCVVPPPGRLTRIQKILSVRLAQKENRIFVQHTLVNGGNRVVRLAPWALSVMAPGGTAIIPLPAKIPHTRRLSHTQVWSLWGYTDLSDPRWALGSRYVRLRHDARRGPTKLGLAHREGWVAYQLGAFVFVKRFRRLEGRLYPDGDVNFETFANETFLELETLGPLVDLAPGHRVTHNEEWLLFRGVPHCQTEADVDTWICPLAKGRTNRKRI